MWNETKCWRVQWLRVFLRNRRRRNTRGRDWQVNTHVIIHKVCKGGGVGERLLTPQFRPNFCLLYSEYRCLYLIPCQEFGESRFLGSVQSPILQFISVKSWISRIPIQTPIAVVLCLNNKAIIQRWRWHFFQYRAYENSTDLNLCEGLRIFFFFCFPDTGLYLLNGFDLLEFFLFLMAWQWKPAISVAQTATRGSFFRMLFTNSFCRCCYAHDMCYRKLQQKEACGKSYHIVQLYLTTYLRKGCSGCGKYAPWSNCNKAVK